MNTFAWKWWRFAWLAHSYNSDRVTVYDYSGTWESVCGRLCFMVKRAEQETRP